MRHQSDCSRVGGGRSRTFTSRRGRTGGSKADPEYQGGVCKRPHDRKPEVNRAITLEGSPYLAVHISNILCSANQQVQMRARNSHHKMTRLHWFCGSSHRSRWRYTGIRRAVPCRSSRTYSPGCVSTLQLKKVLPTNYPPCEACLRPLVHACVCGCVAVGGLGERGKLRESGVHRHSGEVTRGTCGSASQIRPRQFSSACVRPVLHQEGGGCAQGTSHAPRGGVAVSFVDAVAAVLVDEVLLEDLVLLIVAHCAERDDPLLPRIRLRVAARRRLRRAGGVVEVVVGRAILNPGEEMGVEAVLGQDLADHHPVCVCVCACPRSTTELATHGRSWETAAVCTGAVTERETVMLVSPVARHQARGNSVDLLCRG